MSTPSLSPQQPAPRDDLDDGNDFSLPQAQLGRTVVCGGDPIHCGPRRDRDLEDDLIEAFEAFRS